MWGGGHDLAGVAGVGVRGPGHNGHRRGYDCSGSVAAVLAGAGLWPAGSGVPNDYGLIQYLARAGLIARGPGPAPNAVNLFDRAYHRWHLLPGVLRDHVIYGHSYTFQTDPHPELLYGAEIGDTVRAGYLQWPTGSLGLQGLAYSGAATISGTVTALTGSSLTVQSAAGQTRVLDMSLVANLLSGVQTGAGVTLTYSRDLAHQLIPHALQITSPPPTAPPGPSPPAPTPSAPAPAPAPAPPPGS